MWCPCARLRRQKGNGRHSSPASVSSQHTGFAGLGDPIALLGPPRFLLSGLKQQLPDSQLHQQTGKPVVLLPTCIFPVFSVAFSALDSQFRFPFASNSGLYFPDWSSVDMDECYKCPFYFFRNQESKRSVTGTRHSIVSGKSTVQSMFSASSHSCLFHRPQLCMCQTQLFRFSFIQKYTFI